MELDLFLVGNEDELRNTIKLLYAANQGYATMLGYQNTMIKNNKQIMKDCLRKLYEEIKHGDEEHQLWLKNKVEDFILKEIK